MLLVAFIVSDWLPYLRGPAPETAEWYWPYRLRPYPLWLVPTLATLLFGLAAIGWLRLEGSGRAVNAALFLLAAAAFLLQMALMNADSASIGDELINRVYSNLESGFFIPAAELDNLNEALKSYPALMPTFSSEHARTHPPGLLILNRLTIQFFAQYPALANRLAAPAIAARCIDLWLLDRPPAVSAALLTWAILPLLAAAGAVFPAWWLARAMLADRAAAKLATLLIVTLPALLLFAPKSVQFYAPLALLIFLAFYRGLQKWQMGWFFLSGLLLSLATFLSLGNGALALLLAVYALLHGWQAAGGNPHFQPPPGARALSAGVCGFILGAAAVWVAYWAGWGVPPWEIVQTGLAQHYTLVTNLRRYPWWLAWNLVDVTLFAGWVVTVGFTAVGLRALRHRPLTPAHLLALSSAVLILALDISGAARGEVGRLWLFLYPFMALVASQFLAGAQPGWRRQGLLIAWQLLLALALALAWQPVRAVAVVATRPFMPVAVPAVQADTLFGDAIRLTGYTIETADEEIRVTLSWHREGWVARPYTVFNQLLDRENKVVAQQDNWPVDGQWPPTCWQNGEQVVDTYILALPATLPVGEYRLITGWYDGRDGRRLNNTLSQDASELALLTWDGSSFVTHWE